MPLRLDSATVSLGPPLLAASFVSISILFQPVSAAGSAMVRGKVARSEFRMGSSGFARVRGGNDRNRCSATRLA
jgi:hypothetical protein